jgi:hypothetical protein
LWTTEAVNGKHDEGRRVADIHDKWEICKAYFGF